MPETLRPYWLWAATALCCWCDTAFQVAAGPLESDTCCDKPAAFAKAWWGASACDPLIQPPSPAQLVARCLILLQATDEPDASPEVLFPTAFSGHTALTRCRQPSGQSRSGVHIRRQPWRSPQPPSHARPCGFPHGSRVRPTPALFPLATVSHLRACIAIFRFKAMFRSLLMSLRGLVGSSLTRRRSWGCALRSFAPACRCPSVGRLSEPTCRWSERPYRSFSSGDQPSCAVAQYTHLNRTARSRTFRTGSWALPLPASRAAIANRTHGGRYCLGLWPLSGLRTSAYGCA
jgi:hypothetical protein